MCDFVRLTPCHNRSTVCRHLSNCVDSQCLRDVQIKELGQCFARCVGVRLAFLEFQLIVFEELSIFRNQLMVDGVLHLEQRLFEVLINFVVARSSRLIVVDPELRVVDWLYIVQVE